MLVDYGLAKQAVLINGAGTVHAARYGEVGPDNLGVVALPLWRADLEAVDGFIHSA